VGKQIIIWVSLFIAGCASYIPQDWSKKKDGGKHYKRDMILSEGGYEGVGVLVLPQKDEYRIKVKAKGNLDLLTVESCHRVDSIEKAWEKIGVKSDGWFSRKSKNEVVIGYRPVKGIETGGVACPLRIGGYEKTDKRHSRGFIDFRDDALRLKLDMKCSGKASLETGVAICQAKSGTIQEISFVREVLSSGLGDCVGLTSPNSRVFRFKIKQGKCVYRFREDSAEGESFRLTTIGYDGILIREK